MLLSDFYLNYASSEGPVYYTQNFLGIFFSHFSVKDRAILSFLLFLFYYKTAVSNGLSFKGLKIKLLNLLRVLVCDL